MAKSTAAPRLRRRERKNITSGTAHVSATFNNTMITITDAQGNTIAWSSSGSQGFKGSRKSTPYAAQVAAEDAGRKAMEHGMRTLDIEVKGPGSGRESALRALQRRQEDAPQRVAEGQAETALQRLRNDGGDAFCIAARLDRKLLGFDQGLPVFLQHDDLNG